MKNRTSSPFTQILLLLALFTMLAFSVQAQVFRIGPRIGASSTAIEPQDLLIGSGEDFSELRIKLANSSPEIHGGLWTRLTILAFYLQPELLYSTYKGSYEIEVDGGDPLTVEERFHDLNIPVMLGLKLGPVRANAGPVFHVALDNPKNLIDLEEMDRRFRSTTVGLQGGLGLDLGKKVILDVKYETNFGANRDEITLGSQTFEVSQRSSRMIVGLGYAF
jgi:hypothetical protein